MFFYASGIGTGLSSGSATVRCSTGRARPQRIEPLRNISSLAGAILVSQRALFVPVPNRAYCGNEPTKSSDQGGYATE
jgi:hypothetical protein